MEEMTNNTIPWYERSFTLDQAMDMIQGSMKSAVRNYVAVGFYLKAIRDRKLFEEAGYKNFEEFVRDKYDRDKGWASRCIKVNDQLSKEGNTPLLSEDYKDYSVSQLIELAGMTDEQRAQVTPETSVREMKQIRNPKPAEPKKVATLQLPEETMHHFTDGERNIDSAYGATISVIVKAYLATGLQEECMVTAWGDTYKVLRRPQITVFYTDAGTTLFDVENSRLEKEYQHWYGSKGVVNQEEPPNQEGDATISQQPEPQTELEDQAEPDTSTCPPGPAGQEFDQTIKEPDDIGNPGQTEESHDMQQGKGGEPWEEQKMPDENWNLGDIPQAKEKHVAKLAKKVVEEYGSRMIFRFGGLSGKEAVKMLTSKCGGDIDIGDDVNAYATDGTIEFYSGDTDLGVCSYSKFETQVEKTLEVWRQEQKTEKVATDLSEPDELPEREEPQEQESDIDAEFTDITEPDEELDEKPPTDLQIARQELERANNLLKKCLKDLPDETNIHIRGMKIKVAALELYVRALDDTDNLPPKPEQPELPLLRNNDQRAAFVDAYQAWPLWIETKETGERYYRYDLTDGTSMVVKVYHARLFDYSKTDLPWEERYTERYGIQEYYLLKPGKFFKNCEANRSALIEKLKENQKKGL